MGGVGPVTSYNKGDMQDIMDRMYGPNGINVMGMNRYGGFIGDMVPTNAARPQIFGDAIPTAKTGDGFSFNNAANAIPVNATNREIAVKSFVDVNIAQSVPLSGTVTVTGTVMGEGKITGALQSSAKASRGESAPVDDLGGMAYAPLFSSSPR